MPPLFMGVQHDQQATFPSRRAPAQLWQLRGVWGWARALWAGRERRARRRMQPCPCVLPATVTSLPAFKGALGSSWYSPAVVPCWQATSEGWGGCVPICPSSSCVPAEGLLQPHSGERPWPSPVRGIGGDVRPCLWQHVTPAASLAFRQLPKDWGAWDIELGPLDHRCGRVFSSSQPDALVCQVSVAVMQIL